jgi:hypothetical protein
MHHGHSYLTKSFNSILVTQNFKKQLHAAQASQFPNFSTNNQSELPYTSHLNPLLFGISAAPQLAVCIQETTKKAVPCGFTSNLRINTGC